GSLSTTAASAASGCTGLLRAILGAAAFFGAGIGQLERAGLGCQAKNQPCFSGSRERHGESQPIVLGLFIRELISFGNTQDPTSQVFLNFGLEDRSKYLWEGCRAKHAPSKVDASAQLHLAARGISSRSCYPRRRSRPQRQPRVQNVSPH